MDSKEKRNKEIIKLHNSGMSSQQIADKVGLSKAGVYKIIKDYIDTLPNDRPVLAPEVVKPEPATMQTGNAETVTTPATNVTGSGKRITSFGELQHTGNPNEYANKQTGEILKVKFVPAKAPDQCGHFETV